MSPSRDLFIVPFPLFCNDIIIFASATFHLIQYQRSKIAVLVNRTLSILFQNFLYLIIEFFTEALLPVPCNNIFFHSDIQRNIVFLHIINAFPNCYKSFNFFLLRSNIKLQLIKHLRPNQQFSSLIILIPWCQIVTFERKFFNEIMYVFNCFYIYNPFAS